jgi:hypothetical protein
MAIQALLPKLTSWRLGTSRKAMGMVITIKVA